MELSYQWSLEHLMPQSWEKHWKAFVKDESHAEDLIYQIGNMTLLKGSLNSTIKNATWQIKLRRWHSQKLH
ncbi:HNH endonuclease family protein [Helicobacter himalayensis]|uniref:HNH endonuclease family protein n=1 Tax=Helicobacter himalayensis TaxID=1591088 RepID=UPI003AAA7C3A